MDEPAIAFCVREHEQPALELRVNFGVFAGRDVTAAEIDDLARQLVSEIDRFAIVSEQRHEFAGAVEAALHIVRIEIPPDAAGSSVDELCDRLLGAAEAWAEACVAERHAEL